MRRLIRLLLALSGLIPVLFLLDSPPDPMLLVYSLFVLALFPRPYIVSFVQSVPLRPFVKLVLLVIISGMVAECLAWAGNYLARSEEPALFHPQLIPDLILGLGFYGGWALAWIIILRRYRFSLASVFMTTGFLGVAIEQDSQVLISILQAIRTNPLVSVSWQSTCSSFTARSWDWLTWAWKASFTSCSTAVAGSSTRQCCC